SLKLFEEVADAARRELENKRDVSGSNAFANLNTLNDEAAMRSLMEIGEGQTKDLLTLAKEPAVARIVAEDDHGRRITYFISRAAPLGHTLQGAQLASYRAPIGRLASLPLGSILTVSKP